MAEHKPDPAPGNLSINGNNTGLGMATFICVLLPCTVSFVCSVSRRYVARAIYIFQYFLCSSSLVPGALIHKSAEVLT